MHRIDTSGHLNNRFTDGDPTQDQEATIVDAAFLNATQEELAQTVEGLGGALAKGTNNQLLARLVARFSAIGHDHDVKYSGLGHNHDAEYSGLGHNHDAEYSGLGHNHDAEYSALGHGHGEQTTIAGKDIWHDGLITEWGNSYKGYYRFPDGMMLQWGHEGPLDKYGTEYLYPTSFVSGALFILAGYWDTASSLMSTMADTDLSIWSVNKSAFKAVTFGKAGPYFHFVAWGK